MLHRVKGILMAGIIGLWASTAYSGEVIQVNVRDNSLKHEEKMFIDAWQHHLGHPSLKSGSIKNPDSFIKNNAKQLITSVQRGKLEHIRAIDGDDVLMSSLISQELGPQMEPSSLFMRVVLFKEGMPMTQRQAIWQKFLGHIKVDHPEAKNIYFALIDGKSEHADFLNSIGFKNTHQRFKRPEHYPGINTRNMELWSYPIA